LYIGLGGNRGGELKTYRNLLLTMVIAASGTAPAGLRHLGTIHGGNS